MGIYELLYASEGRLGFPPSVLRRLMMPQRAEGWIDVVVWLHMSQRNYGGLAVDQIGVKTAYVLALQKKSSASFVAGSDFFDRTIFVGVGQPGFWIGDVSIKGTCSD